MFDNNFLIKLSGLSRRTFYRYLAELKNQSLILKGRKHYYDAEEAAKIAEKMGFKYKLEQHLVSNGKENKGR